MTYFVDTNVLVYARDATEPSKQKLAHDWLDRLWKQRSGKLSYQVLQEYYVTVTGKLTPGLPVADARDDVRAFQVWNPLVTDKNVFDVAWSVQDRFGFSWWDSLVVAAAQVLNCDYLLTEDLQHHQVVDGLVILDPFREESP